MPSPRARAGRSPSRRPARSTRSRWALLLVLAVAIGIGTPMWQDARAGADVPVTAADLADARTALDGLAVKGRAARTGYERSAFGQAWADVDRNGCDTRNDILRRDLVDLTFKADTDGCTVLTGTLTDPYGGEVIAFERGERSSEVQIDHVVALSDAWQKGAQQWTDEVRTAFANDPANLLAVDGPLNQQKGAGDAATWLPPLKGYRCVYVVRQIRVKSAYGLWVTQAEHDAMSRELDRCVTAPAAS